MYTPSSSHIISDSLQILVKMMVSSAIKQYQMMLGNLAQQPENLTKLEAIAQNGDAEVMYILGWCYFTGKYLPQDFIKSMYWLEKAKASGDARAEELMVYCRFLQIAEWSRDAKKT